MATKTESITIDVNSITLNEIEACEEQFGVTFGDLFPTGDEPLLDKDGNPLLDDNGNPRMKPGKMSIRSMKALAWVTLRRTDPTITPEQAGDSVTVGSFNAPRPTKAAPAGNGASG